MAQIEARAGNEASSDKREASSWLVHVVIGFLLVTILISVWNLYSIRGLTANLSEQLASQAASQGIFLGVDGFGIGRLAPDVPVHDLRGEILSFTRVANKHNVIYIASDTCPVCKLQFPELNSAASTLGKAGGSMAVVTMINQTSLADMQSQYGFNFEIYQIEKEDLRKMNLVGTPTLLLFRRAVLGDAFSSPTVEQITKRLLRSMDP